MLTAILFDLDGTLVDSIELILDSARFAFEGFSGTAPTDEQWRTGIGRPLVTMFREFVADEVEVDRLIERYREYQLANHDRLVHAYDGIVPMLTSLASAGHPLALVTSKTDQLARRALEHVGLSASIPVVVGFDSCTRHKPHPEPVERALALLGAAPQNALFVGDSPHDVESGREAGVFTIGVSWGAFTADEMARSGANLVVHDASSLHRAIVAFSPVESPTT